MTKHARSAILCALLSALSFSTAQASDAALERGENGLRHAIANACERTIRETPGFQGDCAAQRVGRRPIAGDVVIYDFELRVGPGPHDIIGLHRVVRETAPFRPVRTAEAVLFAHGDIWGFEGAFLGSLAAPSMPDDRALPVFLAENGVDVWGVDFRWARVPAETTDFTFMKDWGMETDARDLGVALAVARLTRAATGDGLGRIHLLGWSRGAQTGYAYLNAETQAPKLFRHVAGFIPVDVYLKTDDEALLQAACTRLAGAQAQHDAGVYESRNGQLIAALGTLAAVAPADASPIVSGMTNRQAALLAGTATFAFFPPGLGPVPFYHWAGGTFDAQGLPAGLTYTNETEWFEVLQNTVPYQSAKVVLDGDAATCGDVPFDDHLAEIRVPVLYVGAGGGFGDYGVYTTTLLGSTDVTTHVVSVVPPEARLFDIGHADIFTGTDAPTLFWQPILEWIQAH